MPMQISPPSFSHRNNVYAGDKTKPIPVETVLTLNSTGHVVNAWGKDMFFMPHMITIDKQNCVWMTDVAMHQVTATTRLYDIRHVFSHDLFRTRSSSLLPTEARQSLTSSPSSCSEDP